MLEANRLYVGDCMRVMRDIDDGSVDLVFADPPYNIGYVYDSYNDNLPPDQYVEWCCGWMEQCRRVLNQHGSMYVAIGDDFAAELVVTAKRLGFFMRNWIIWSYAFGQSMQNKFGRDHTHILYLTKSDKARTFNADAVRYPGARHAVYGDNRASEAGRVPGDVWSEFPRVCGTFSERVSDEIGCQIPEMLLTRIILASSNIGDLVLDPLVGSGTIPVVAKRLGRRWVGIDVSQSYVDAAQKRINAVQDCLSDPPSELWHPYHEATLSQLYRETGLASQSLSVNETALRCMAFAMKQRTGREYSIDEIIGRITLMRDESRLPRLPNDTLFQPKQSTTIPKPYERERVRIRRRSAPR